MGSHETHIEHDGGLHLVEAVVNADGTVTIYFGASFTLRLDEHNVDKFRRLLHDASKDLVVQRGIAVINESKVQDAIEGSVDSFEKSVSGVEVAVEAMKNELADMTQPENKPGSDSWPLNDPADW